ncbi:MAG: hypothetical protein O2905_00140 [Proteobacteria bacterium]|nr:hypothetical protein [Pseudomonadota bacterium]MDA1131621.1 hypothetical protein [Pseudomonadota bacterium]
MKHAAKTAALGLAAALAVAPASAVFAADGVLAGFGGIPFGATMAAAKAAPDIEIRDEPCNANTCQLIYRTTADGYPVTVWQNFTDDAAGLAEVLIRASVTGSRFTNTSQCDRAFNRVFTLLQSRYGAADVPIVQRNETVDAAVVEVREVTFSFPDGASIREKRDVTADGTCGLRLFYRPSQSVGNATRF